MNIRCLDSYISSGSPKFTDIMVCPFRVLLETLVPREPVDPLDLL